MFLEWGCGTFLGRTSMHNTLIRHWCTCKTKGLHRQSFRLLHTSTDHLSSSSAPSLPPLRLRLLPSVLSPYPLINQVVHFHPRKKNELWSSFPSSLSLSKQNMPPFFSSCPPPPQQTKHTSSRHTILCECIYLNAPCPASVVVFYGVLQSEVNTPNLICLFCFIFQGGTFPPHISWEIGEKQREGGRRGGGRESDQKHGVLYSTWSCFIISWSSSDTSYDGVLDPGEVCV